MNAVRDSLLMGGGMTSLWTRDPVLAHLLREAAEDPETGGLILSGSRGAALGDAESDYDVLWVLSDGAYAARAARADPHAGERQPVSGMPYVDLEYTCLRRLRELVTKPSWRTSAFTTAQVLLDKTGEVAAAVQAIATVPDERAREDAARAFDAYLNAFYRSLKAWHRGNELGARLQAAESITHLIRTLFALAHRWPPYHDRLGTQLALLDAQGWPPGYLHDTLLGILRTGDPRLQQQLETGVETLLRAHGFGHIVDGWGGEIERVRGFTFA